VSTITVTLQEGFANRLCQYAFARAYAEKMGCELRTSFWMGQEIFNINDPLPDRVLPDRDIESFPDWDGQVDINLVGWGQHQKHLIYSRADARRYFTFRPEILEKLMMVPQIGVAAHIRWGDFLHVPAANFIAISKESYYRCCYQYGLPVDRLRFVSEEDPIVVPGISTGSWDPPHSEHHTRGREDKKTSLGFLPDFFALMRAKVLIRSNSTFGLWAGFLGTQERVFSPNLTDIQKQPEAQDVPFVEGNHMPITGHWSGHSELHIRDQ
jgi:hypothetical protein